MEDLRNQIEEAETANETCDELEKIAQMKVEELKTIREKMKLAITSQIRGVNEDGTRPLESGAVVQLGSNLAPILGLSKKRLETFETFQQKAKIPTFERYGTCIYLNGYRVCHIYVTANFFLETFWTDSQGPRCFSGERKVFSRSKSV